MNVQTLIQHLSKLNPDDLVLRIDCESETRTEWMNSAKHGHAVAIMFNGKPRSKTNCNHNLMWTVPAR